MGRLCLSWLWWLRCFFLEDSDTCFRFISVVKWLLMASILMRFLRLNSVEWASVSLHLGLQENHIVWSCRPLNGAKPGCSLRSFLCLPHDGADDWRRVLCCPWSIKNHLLPRWREVKFNLVLVIIVLICWRLRLRFQLGLYGRLRFADLILAAGDWHALNWLRFFLVVYFHSLTRYLQMHRAFFGALRE